ncbi:hypothetical protein [Gellertiella hungarica]|uniref:Uncharacterized protein n=1 Tax=Gellertiella hungarica TaxID=1572859 RepID=A0A7W6J3F6_9HYPH|nr:hypothetical protein [Gellertiella hungarica]MBB4064018.1 hypothetical protein [Gellertiella hungarica]
MKITKKALAAAIASQAKAESAYDLDDYRARLEVLKERLASYINNMKEPPSSHVIYFYRQEIAEMTGIMHKCLGYSKEQMNAIMLPMRNCFVRIIEDSPIGLYTRREGDPFAAVFGRTEPAMGYHLFTHEEALSWIIDVGHRLMGYTVGDVRAAQQELKEIRRAKFTV